MCRLFFHALIVLAAFNAIPVSKAAARPDAPGKPSFLLIATEDMGCSGTNEVHAPNLDQLAAEVIPPGIFLPASQTRSC